MSMNLCSKIQSPLGIGPKVVQLNNVVDEKEQTIKIKGIKAATDP